MILNLPFGDMLWGSFETLRMRLPKAAFRGGQHKRPVQATMWQCSTAPRLYAQVMLIQFSPTALAEYICFSCPVPQYGDCSLVIQLTPPTDETRQYHGDKPKCRSHWHLVALAILLRRYKLLRNFVRLWANRGAVQKSIRSFDKISRGLWKYWSM